MDQVLGLEGRSICVHAPVVANARGDKDVLEVARRGLRPREDRRRGWSPRRGHASTRRASTRSRSSWTASSPTPDRGRLPSRSRLHAHWLRAGRHDVARRRRARVHRELRVPRRLRARPSHRALLLQQPAGRLPGSRGSAHPRNDPELLVADARARSRRVLVPWTSPSATTATPVSPIASATRSRRRALAGADRRAEHRSSRLLLAHS